MTDESNDGYVEMAYVVKLEAEIASANGRADYWKAEHLEGNKVIDELKARVAELESHAPITPLVEDVVKAGVYSFVAMKLPGEQHE